MNLRRAISLVPSATDVVVALGAGDALVGISSDCDQPDEMRPLPVVTGAVIEPSVAAADGALVDRMVREELAAGASLYRLDVDTIVSLAPEVVFAQDQCSVCAVPSAEVTSALAGSGVACDVVSVDPVGLDEVLSSFSRIGRVLGAGEAGEALESSCRQRLEDLRGRRSSSPAAGRPRVVVLDWVDPPFAAGNWVPELVDAAGGEAVLVGVPAGGAGGPGPLPSRQVTVDDVVGAKPDVVVVAPCGLGLEAATNSARAVATWFDSGPAVGRPRVIAFDGRIWFSRPGPRLVEGVEALSALLAGERLPAAGAFCGVVEITEDSADERGHGGISP